MAEEVKKEEQKAGNKIVGTLIKVIIGLALLALGGYLVYHWIGALKTVIKGCLGLFLILVGIITLAVAKE